MKLIKMLFAASWLLFCALTSCQQTLLPYQNANLSASERAADLCGRLSVEEKARIMMDNSMAVERLGIPAFSWWSEALHGVGRNGTATMFPSCIGMAASFDTSLIYDVYSAVSDEARAKNTILRREGFAARYQGLSFWTPNINIFRDPRWGRGQETYGEDPYVNSVMGCAVVRGLQGPEGHRYRKLLACAKHFAVHSGPEKTRHHFDIRDLSSRDLWETYLPAFESLVRDANVREVMCAYQRLDGEPCCGSNRLLQHILRDKWQFDGIVVSDCGAVGDFYVEGCHGVAADAAQASAQAVLAGTDVECGGNYSNLPLAVRRGEISEEKMDVSVRRLLTARFELGDFDDDELVEWTRIGKDVIASEKNIELSRKAARESMVLLQNKNNILPLSKDDVSRMIVMGPNAKDSIMLWGIYFGSPSHTVTMFEGIKNKIGDVSYAKGCGLTDMTDTESLFDMLVTPNGQKGVEATYWNNEKFDGEPIRSEVYSAPIILDNGGNTVFAPGVNLEHFSMRLKCCFVAKNNETIYLDYGHDDDLKLVVNGDTIHKCWNDYQRSYHKAVEVEAGKNYDIVIEYVQQLSGASFQFDVTKIKNTTVDMAVAAAANSEIVIFVGGISPDYEREEAWVNAPGFDNGDRTSIELPKVQRNVLNALHKAGKKIVFVCCSGSAVALAPETISCDAIIEAWYAGEQGGNALADVLFGDYNPSGRLPVTFYASDNDLPDFDDYNMKAGKGRTYRYFRDSPLFPFGYGLSYTTFEYEDVKWDNCRRGVSLVVKNKGSRDGDESVLAYVRDTEDAEGPHKSLRAFVRVSVKAGEKSEVFIPMPDKCFKLWNEHVGEMQIKPDAIYEVMIGDVIIRVDGKGKALK